MSIKESALTAITSITNSDLIRAVTSAGASRRITVANLAKHFIENYAGSTIGGSAQTLKSAIDSLNSKLTFENGTTPTITKTSGGTARVVNCGKYGKIRCLSVAITADSDVNSGSNLYVGTISSEYEPKVSASAVGYSGASAIVATINTSGVLTARVIGENLSAGSEPYINFIYIAK